MKMFEVQIGLKSYTYPVVKIIICLAIVALCLARDRLIQISAPWVNMLITVLCCVLTLASILCVYISMAECCEIFWNRRKGSKGDKDRRLEDTC